MSQDYIDARLRKVDNRQRLLCLIQRTAAFVCLILCFVILLAVALTRGWITTPGVAVAWIVLLSAFALLGWIILAMVVLGQNSERSRVAGALERVQPKLLDRLNTIVFLERSKNRAEVAPFYREIVGQASQILQEPPPSSPYPASRVLPHLICCGLLLWLTLWIIDRHSPWQQMMEAQKSKAAVAAVDPPPNPAPEIQIPPADTLTTDPAKTWGEVRITEPARDLKLTKVDVLPLEIEAAASSPLTKTAWSTSLNGAEETPHPLPAAPEPRYAVYKPEVYLDELQLSDWDVLSYYAWSTTDAGDRYASDIYFAEIRPFREDILKLPGGTEGEAYQALSELTALVERQQHILRETHRHVQAPPQDTKLAQQDTRKLAEAEADLRQAVDHLYARLASEMENKPIGEALDHLATGSRHAQDAANHLHNHQARQAQPDEHSALAQLIAARKSFQRSVSENPNSFQDESGEPPPPVAGLEDQLKSMAEFRNEENAAKEFVQTAVEMQQSLANQTERSASRDYPKIARSENDLRKSVQEFTEQHPRLFKDLQKETEQVEKTMKQASESLTKRLPEARQTTRQAAEQLEELQQRMQKQSSEQQLADAYRLKQMLDKQIETLGQCQRAPGTFSGSELRQTGTEARQTIKQLSQIAQDGPAREAFSQPLRDALKPEAVQSINQSLTQLQRAISDEDKTNTAQKAQQALTQVSQAFDQSLPQALQASRQADPLKPGSAEDQMARGLEQLQRLVQQLQNPARPQNQEKQKRLGQEALSNLRQGLEHGSDQPEPVPAVLADLEKALDPVDQPFDPVQLQQLLDKLRRFSQELAGPEEKNISTPDLSNIDPARLPPAYRAQIEKYFQKLSER